MHGRPTGRGARRASADAVAARPGRCCRVRARAGGDRARSSTAWAAAGESAGRRWPALRGGRAGRRRRGRCAPTTCCPERALDGDARARRTLCRTVYRPLPTPAATLLDTVRAVPRTAAATWRPAPRALFVHPNTVRYRLKRVAEVCGLVRRPTRAAAARCRSPSILGRLDRLTRTPLWRCEQPTWLTRWSLTTRDARDPPAGRICEETLQSMHRQCPCVPLARHARPTISWHGERRAGHPRPRTGCADTRNAHRLARPSRGRGPAPLVLGAHRRPRPAPAGHHRRRRRDQGHRGHPAAGRRDRAWSSPASWSCPPARGATSSSPGTASASSPPPRWPGCCRPRRRSRSPPSAAGRWPRPARSTPTGMSAVLGGDPDEVLAGHRGVRADRRQPQRRRADRRGRRAGRAGALAAEPAGEARVMPAGGRRRVPHRLHGAGRGGARRRRRRARGRPTRSRPLLSNADGTAVAAGAEVLARLVAR